MLPYLLATGSGILAWMVARHLNSKPAPILTALLAALLLLGGAVEARHRAAEDRYSEATRTLLGREDTHVVCERLSAAMFNAWNRDGYVAWTTDGSKPSRADLNWDTCRALRAWERSGRNSSNTDQVLALHVLTHEAMHLNGHYNEAEAECFAVQHDSRMAQLLGAAPNDADQLALSYYERIYPRMRDEYRSAECVPGGVLDQSPDDQRWP